MSSIASHITSLTIVYLSVYSGADQRKHQSSESLAFVRGIHRRPVNSLRKGPVTRKMFPFDDVIMWCLYLSLSWLLFQFSTVIIIDTVTVVICYCIIIIPIMIYHHRNRHHYFNAIISFNVISTIIILTSSSLGFDVSIITIHNISASLWLSVNVNRVNSSPPSAAYICVGSSLV